MDAGLAALLARKFPAEQQEPHAITVQYAGLMAAVNDFITDLLLPQIDADDPASFVDAQGDSNYAKVLQAKILDDMGTLIFYHGASDHDVLEALIWRFLFRYVLADSQTVLEELFETRWESRRPAPGGMNNPPARSDKETYENGGRFVGQIDKTLLGMAFSSRDDAEYRQWLNSRRLAIRTALKGNTAARYHADAGLAYKTAHYTNDLATILDAFHNNDPDAFRTALSTRIMQPAVDLRIAMLLGFYKYQLTLEAFGNPNEDINEALLRHVITNDSMDVVVLTRRRRQGRRVAFADYFREQQPSVDLQQALARIGDDVFPMCAITPALVVGEWPRQPGQQPPVTVPTVLVKQVMAVRLDNRQNETATAAGGLVWYRMWAEGCDGDEELASKLPTRTWSGMPQPEVAYGERARESFW